MPKRRQVNRIDKSRAMSSYEIGEADRNVVEVGTVKFFNTTKGFGFAEPEDPDKAAVFIPGALLTRVGIGALYPGDRIEYERIPDKHGRTDCANRIKLLV
jgi:CspA family cold shock protein